MFNKYFNCIFCAFRQWFALPSFLAVLVMLGTVPTAEAWWNNDWTFRKQISLDAGPTGMGLQTDGGRMPVLIRLHDGNLKFSDVKEDGSDIRFVAEDDKTPLKFHIEKFDSIFGMGLIWVDVPFVKAGAASHIWMYYGNEKAPAGEDSRGSFDADQVLVYHFGEKNLPPKDATAYANNAASAVGGSETALIGRGARFDGTAGLALPASPSLVLSDGGAMTWSAWIKPDPVQQTTVLYARRESDKFLIIGLNQGVPYAQVSRGGGVVLTTEPGAALPGDGWHLISVTAADKVTLYVDGEARATMQTALPAMTATASIGGDAGASPVAAPSLSSDAKAGARPAPTAASIPASANYIGEMDELRIAKVARSIGYVQAEWGSENVQSKFVSFGIDEQLSSWSSGYAGILLRSVTFDGWVVICVLMVLLVVSWTVMVNRFLYTRWIEKTNSIFLDVFRAVDRDLVAITGIAEGAKVFDDLTPKDCEHIRSAPLFRLCQEGLSEARRRAGRTVDGKPMRITLGSVRTVLDEFLVREVTSLNRYMVVLTIAIAGGPFIGLLGTVVGVMITFAAIAASGDVNVNAIAPGIAAALVATVAGLFVAIPALFGYNYLVTKIKALSLELNVFSGSVVTMIEDLVEEKVFEAPVAAE